MKAKQIKIESTITKKYSVAGTTITVVISCPYDEDAEPILEKTWNEVIKGCVLHNCPVKR